MSVKGMMTQQATKQAVSNLTCKHPQGDNNTDYTARHDLISTAFLQNLVTLDHRSQISGSHTVL